MFAVEQVDERFEEGLDVLAAVVAELHQEVKQSQNLQHTRRVTSIRQLSYDTIRYDRR